MIKDERSICYVCTQGPEGKILAVAVEIIMSGELKVELDHWLQFFISIIIGITISSSIHL